MACLRYAAPFSFWLSVSCLLEPYHHFVIFLSALPGFMVRLAHILTVAEFDISYKSIGLLGLSWALSYICLEITIWFGCYFVALIAMLGPLWRLSLQGVPWLPVYQQGKWQPFFLFYLWLVSLDTYSVLWASILSIFFHSVVSLSQAEHRPGCTLRW